MSYRKVILATNEIYHVYNRGVEKRPIFLIRKDYLRFNSLVNYYRFANCPIKFSHFKQLSAEERNNILARLDKGIKKTSRNNGVLSYAKPCAFFVKTTS